MTSASLLHTDQWNFITNHLFVNWFMCTLWFFSWNFNQKTLILTNKKSHKDQHDISSGSVLNDLHLKAEVCTDKSQKDCRPLYLGSSRKIGSDLMSGRESFFDEDDFENGENDMVFFCGLSHSRMLHTTWNATSIPELGRGDLFQNQRFHFIS